MSAFAGMCPKCGTTHDLFLAVDGSIVCRVDRDAQVEAEVRERLRAQVEALPRYERSGGAFVKRDDVLALLDGAS